MKFEIPDEAIKSIAEPILESVIKRVISDEYIRASASHAIREEVSARKDEIVEAAVEGAINGITLRVARNDLYKKFLQDGGLL